MVRKLLLMLSIFITAVFFVSCSAYKDGSYEGISQGGYRTESYYGVVKLDIAKGKITQIDFKIIDSNLNEVFDGNYEKHFAGNDMYIQQSRNDWAGVQAYPGLLLKAQNIKKVDGISGATWSYNIFKYSVIRALEKAK